jgi:Uma2 family endonuclease
MQRNQAMAIDLRQPALHMTWEEDELVLSLAPLQGRWTAEQYLLLTDQTNHLIEFTEGYIEVLPMPTENHQAMLEFLFLALRAFIEQFGGKVRFAPLRVQIRAEKFREPDILLVRDASDPRRQNRYWLGADLVAEIVSPDSPERDTKEKRADYAEAGIPEYWIVNPENETVTVLSLEAEGYIEHGVFGRGDTAASALLQGFTVQVDAILDAR